MTLRIRRALVLQASRLVLPALFALAGVACATGDVIVDEGSGSRPDDESTGEGSGTPGGGGVGGGSGGGGGGSGSGGASCVPAAESCDGIDNSCDGVVDEGCACATGQTQPCYSGSPPETNGIGACVGGVQTCGASGQWGPCSGEVTPSPEACNLIDDDCNGEADDTMGTTACGVGACQVTVPKCQDGAAPVCTPLLPSAEVCDGIDNNCNQIVDEVDPDAGKACQTGLLGACAAGTTQCAQGALTCVPAVSPSAEKCDGIDNDCDGVADDVAGAGVPCTTGLPGACSAGVSGCKGGALDCVPTVAASLEVCDGLDNNCDDQVDEGDPGGGVYCSTGQAGACAAGTTACSSGSVVCMQNVAAAVEVCNGQDDNCNGQVDEGNPSAGGACSTGLQGTCGTGVYSCANGGLVCVQSAQPVAEMCNDGQDNDCNGVVDNGCAAACAHSKCSTGTKLQSGCDPCVTQVCAVDSYCCSNSWDSTCVSEVSSVCGQSCVGSCAHSKCVTGTALQSGCDPCVTQVCAADSYCCSFSWDAVCVGEVTSICGQSCP